MYNLLMYLKRQKKVFLIMKMSFIICSICFIQISASVYSQNGTFTIETKNTTMRELFYEIERQSQFRFFYNDVLTNVDRKVSIDVREKSINEVLDMILANSGITYRILDNQLIVVSPASLLQQTVITGKVTDTDGNPLPGASVVIKGTVQGTITDTDGAYSLSVPDGNTTLVFSFVGYASQEITVGSQKSINITMSEDARAIEEVVVVAFGTAKKEAYTGSVGVVNSESIKLSQQTNVAQTLVGKVAGVQLSNSTGQFGSSPSILIRGFGSISSGNEPLYVLDGMPYDGDLNNINPSDIESMSVLKDAASNALYGARGANGVIMITTRKGKSGDAKITFDTRIGVNSIALQTYNYIKDPALWYETYYKSVYNQQVNREGDSPADAHTFANNAVSGASTNNYLVYTVPANEDFIGIDGKINSRATLGNRVSFQGQDYWLQPDDWRKEGTRHGLRQEYNLSASGGDSKLNYFSSLGYLDNEGVVPGSSIKRINTRVKTEFQAKKWLKMGSNLSYTHTKLNSVPDGTLGDTGSLWSAISSVGPIYPVYVRDGNKNIMIDQWGEQMYDNGDVAGLSRGISGANPIFLQKFNTNYTSRNALTANGFADFTFFDGLKLTINGGVTIDEYRWTYVADPFVENYSSSSNGGSVDKSHNRRTSYNMQQIINYTKNFERHHFNAMLGHEYYYTIFEYLYGAKTRMFSSNNHELSGAVTDSGAAYSYSAPYNNEGYFLRLQYDYANKLFFSGSFRRDASSRFHVDNRWGNFWSLGGAWLLNRESWFPDIPALDMLKVKASIGSQGNDNIGDFLYADQYNIENAEGQISLVFRQKGKKDITWETNTNFNAGIEFGMFNNRISGTFDYFYRKTSNMLFEFFVAPSNGYTSYFDNVGDMRNSGIELDVNGDILRTNDFVWNVNFNITHVSNKILRLPDERKNLSLEGYEGYTWQEDRFANPSTFFFGENLPMYTFYTRKYAGVDDEGVPMWYIDVLDADGNVTGRETTYDNSQGTKYLCGTSLPKVYGGFGTTARYKGFDLSVNFNYQIGGLVYDVGYLYCTTSPSTTFTGNIHKDLLKAWSPENPSSNIPRLTGGDQTGESDRFLTKGSFVNLQNINFGYTLPNHVTGKFGVANLRLYVSMENLWYKSARQGLDPRYSFFGSTNNQTYPNIRTISGGLTIQF